MIYGIAKSQGASDPTLLRSVVPPSPTTREFEKYTKNPVSLYNGMAEVNIPLYTIEVGGVQIPLSLSYHASGIKNSQLSGEVGLGWFLNPGYRVSRTIYGRKDDAFDMPPIPDFGTFASPRLRDEYLTTIAGSNTSGVVPAPSGVYTKIDSEYDIFNYSLLNTSGAFIISDRTNKKTTLANGEPLLINYNISGVDDAKQIVNFDITDADGVNYNFGSIDGDKKGLEIPFALYSDKSAYTAWAVRSITTPLNQVVNFDYVQYGEITYNPSTTYTLNEGGVFTLGGECVVRDGWNSEYAPYGSYTICGLNTITTDRETLIFSRAADTHMIQSIEIRDNLSTQLIRKIEFQYTTTPGNKFLEKVIIHGNDNDLTEPQVYSFDYDRETYMPEDLDYDFWGYNHGRSKVHSVWAELGQYPIFSCGDGQTRVLFINGSGIVFQDKECNTGALVNMLTKIVYPSKGFTEYQYELNKYKDAAGVIRPGPGVRIAQIRSYNYGASEDTPSLVTNYRYGPGEDGTGVLKFEPRPEHMVTQTLDLDYHESGNYYMGVQYINYISMYDSEAFRELMSVGPIYYGEVAVYRDGSDVLKHNLAGKERYLYNEGGGSHYQTFDTNTSCGTGAEGTQRLNRIYSPVYIRSHAINSNTPDLRRKEIYDKTGIVHSEDYTYSFTNALVFPGLKVRQFASDHVGGPTDLYQEFSLSSFYDYNEYEVETGVTRMTGKTTTTYVNNKAATSIVQKYSYNNAGSVKTELITDNTASSRIHEYTYPSDYAGLTASDDITGGVSNLQGLNVLTSIVEEKQWKVLSTQEKYLLSGKFTKYQSLQPLAQSVSVIESDVPLTDFSDARVENGSLVIDKGYKTKAVYEQYDSRGNVLQRHLQDGKVSSYLWAYQGHYPVAEVIDAQQSDMAYTSFEAAETGNWEVSGHSVTDVSYSCPTGSNVYDLSNGSIFKTITNKATVYVLSYWKMATASVNVSGGNETSYRVGEARDGWVHLEHQFTFDTGGVYIHGSGLIDELRLYPLGAQMTTYTYSPFIGVTSVMDTNGSVQYFEYDGMGRLVLQRDKDRNIIKRYNYRYKK